MTPSERLKIARNFYPKGSRIKSFKIDRYNVGESRDEIVDEGQNMKTYEEYDYSISTPLLKGFIYDAVEDEWATLLDSNGAYIGLPKGLLSYLGMDASMKDASSKAENYWKITKTVRGEHLNTWCSREDRIYYDTVGCRKWGLLPLTGPKKWEGIYSVNEIRVIGGKKAIRFLDIIWVEYDNFYEFITGKSPRYNPDTFEKIVSSQSKTNTNGKEHPKIGSVIEVRRPVATISRGERPRGSAVPGRRREVTTSVGHLSHKPSFIRG